MIREGDAGSGGDDAAVLNHQMAIYICICKNARMHAVLISLLTH